MGSNLNKTNHHGSPFRLRLCLRSVSVLLFLKKVLGSWLHWMGKIYRVDIHVSFIWRGKFNRVDLHASLISLDWMRGNRQGAFARKLDLTLLDGENSTWWISMQACFDCTCWDNFTGWICMSFWFDLIEWQEIQQGCFACKLDLTWWDGGNSTDWIFM